MDPVNKWLFTVILFMSAFLAVVGYKAGSGRYEMQVVDSQYFEKTRIVYVLDTKDGTVRAKMHLEEDLLTGDRARPARSSVKVFEFDRPNQYGRRY